MEINRFTVLNIIKAELNTKILLLEKSNHDVNLLIQQTQSTYKSVFDMLKLTQSLIVQMMSQKQNETKIKGNTTEYSRNLKEKDGKIGKSLTINKRVASNLTSTKTMKSLKVSSNQAKSMPKINTLNKSSKSEGNLKTVNKNVSKSIKGSEASKTITSKTSIGKMNVVTSSKVTNLKIEKKIVKPIKGKVSNKSNEVKEVKETKEDSNEKKENHLENESISKNNILEKEEINEKTIKNETEDKTKPISPIEQQANEHKEQPSKTQTQKHKESFIKNLDNIIKYQTINESIKSLYFNKKLFKRVLTFHINKLEYIIEKFNKKIEDIKLKYKNNIEKDKETDQFKFSKGTEKVAEMINSTQYSKMFTEDSTPIHEILFPYRFLLQVINPKEISPIYEKNDSFIWDFFCKEVRNCIDNKFGSYLLTVLKEKTDFSIGNLINLFELYEKNTEKLQPNYYAKRCGTTGFMIFFIKDIVDYFGMSVDIRKTNSSRALKTYEDIINYYLSLKERSLKRIEKYED